MIPYVENRNHHHGPFLPKTGRRFIKKPNTNNNVKAFPMAALPALQQPNASSLSKSAKKHPTKCHGHVA